MSTYLLINIIVIFFPLALSFDKKIRFYKEIPRVLSSTVIVDFFYIVWDIFAARQGHWGFNNKYVFDFRIAGLPIEEFLFFLTVPYAMLFLYEVFQFYLGKKIQVTVRFAKTSGVIAAVLLAASIIFMGQSYTFLALFSCGIYFLSASLIYKEDVNSGLYWIFMFFSFIPFFIVNYFLTSLPVVTYNPEAIWGLRILTIPVEDFFYSFAMVSFYIMVYKLLGARFSRLSEANEQIRSSRI